MCVCVCAHVWCLTYLDVTSFFVVEQKGATRGPKTPEKNTQSFNKQITVKFSPDHILQLVTRFWLTKHITTGHPVSGEGITYFLSFLHSVLSNHASS